MAERCKGGVMVTEQGILDSFFPGAIELGSDTELQNIKRRGVFYTK